MFHCCLNFRQGLLGIPVISPADPCYDRSACSLSQDYRYVDGLLLKSRWGRLIPSGESERLIVLGVVTLHPCGAQDQDLVRVCHLVSLWVHSLPQAFLHVFQGPVFWVRQ